MILAKLYPFIPEPGLMLWTVSIFGLFWFLMSRFAFKPIANALKKRENDIQESLDQAAIARQEMANLKSEHQVLLDKAKEERSQILLDAKDAAEKYRKEQMAKADAEFRAKVDSALVEIENRKKEAMVSIKNDAGNMALDIAEKILQKELKGNTEQESFVKALVNDIKLN